MLLLISMAAGVAAQPAEIKALGDKMRARRMAYKANYNMYDAYTGGKLLESQQMDVNMWDGELSIKTRLFHVIRNKQQYLYVDLSRKVMMLNKVNNYKEEMKQAEQLRTLIDIDSLFSGKAAVKLLNEKGDERTYRFTHPAGSKHAYSDLTINHKTLTIEKAVMYYSQTLSELLGRHSDLASAKKPRIEMVFTSFVYRSKEEERSFSVGPYLARSGGKYKPLPLYAGYEFIDNTLTR
ncbi:MAG: hypothetical protein V4658_06945 [Bacteroidota bacterium]